MEKKRLSIPSLIVITETALALFFLIYTMKWERNRDWTQVTALVVALLGLTGGVWTQLLQFKKDSHKIGNVKADTGELKPKTDRILQYTEKTEEAVTERLIPTMEQLRAESKTAGSGVNELVEELHFQKRLREEMTLAADRDYFVAGIERLYEENGRLSARVRQLTQERNQLIQERDRLRRILDRISPEQRPYMEPEM